MAHPTPEEISWVYKALETVEEQKQAGVEVPELLPGLRTSLPSPECFSMLGEYGIKVACYRDGHVLLEPTEQFPVLGEDNLMLSQRGEL